MPLLLLMLFLAGPASLVAQATAPDSLRIQRLAALGRLWGVVKYFHPWLLSHDVNWDSAVVAAIPKVSAAGGTAGYAAAVSEMLGTLGDRMTRVLPGVSANTEMPATSVVSTRWEGDSTLVVSVPSFVTNDVLPRLRDAAVLVRAAHRVVFDLRGPAPPADAFGFASYMLNASGLTALLLVRQVSAPSERRRMYSGFPSQAGMSSLNFWAGRYEVAGRTITPAAGTLDRRSAFVVNAVTDIPDVAWAVQQVGSGSLILDSARGASLVDGQFRVVSLGEGVEAHVRVGELVSGSGEPVAADTLLRRDASDDAPLRVALDLVRRPPSAPRVARTRDAFVPSPEESYADMHFPTLGYRVLAAYRWWNAIQFFYPYKTLIGENWDAVLPQSIPRLEAARDSTEYALAVAEMVARIHDSHGFVISPALRAYVGTATPGVLVRYIEGRPIVVRIADDSMVAASGIAVGDVVLQVDGEDAAVRKARLARYRAASTAQALDNAVAAQLLLGPEGSAARLVVIGTGNRARQVTLIRRGGLQYPRSDPIMRMLAGNVGYVDLARLTVPMVDSMFAMFRNSRAIIFDDRGYPQGTVGAIVSRLAVRDGMVAARFRRLLVMSPDSDESATISFTQEVPVADSGRYHGRTVMLIDERAISQAEHTGLYFEAANHTTFIGSPTEGANGDVTTVVLPGGITAAFTGHDVRHGDGRQLQRVGLTPDILVRPTIAGVRAGRDEVLERALRYLQAGRGTAR